jgi:hypothetical protein
MYLPERKTYTDELAVDTSLTSCAGRYNPMDAELQDSRESLALRAYFLAPVVTGGPTSSNQRRRTPRRVRESCGHHRIRKLYDTGSKATNSTYRSTIPTFLFVTARGVSTLQLSASTYSASFST